MGRAWLVIEKRGADPALAESLETMKETPPSLAAVINRRSSGRLKEPGPTEEQLETIIRAGMSAPDHGRLRPWRFVIFEGEARGRFGDILAAALAKRLENQGIIPADHQLNKERNKLLRAPCVVAVCAVIDHDNRIPWTEQFAAVAATCENMLIAATALGIGSMWRTGEPSYDASVKEALGLRENDMITGWIYLGSAEKAPTSASLDEGFDSHVSYWS